MHIDRLVGKASRCSKESTEKKKVFARLYALPSPLPRGLPNKKLSYASAGTTINYECRVGRARRTYRLHQGEGLVYSWHSYGPRSQLDPRQPAGQGLLGIRFMARA